MESAELRFQMEVLKLLSEIARMLRLIHQEIREIKTDHIVQVTDYNDPQ